MLQCSIQIARVFMLGWPFHLHLYDSDRQKTEIHSRPLGLGLPFFELVHVNNEEQGRQYTALPVSDFGCHLEPISEAT